MPEATRAHGGTGAVLHERAVGSLFSTLMAPIVMLQHSWYVFSILMGMATGWNAQTRTDRALPLGLVARKFAPHTLIGAGGGLPAVALCAGQLRLVRAAAGGPVAGHSAGGAVSSSPLLGRLARKDGLFLVPSETRGSKVLGRAHALAASHDEPVSRTAAAGAGRCRGARTASGAAGRDAAARRPIRCGCGACANGRGARDTAGFSRDDWALLLSDSEGLKALA